MAAWNGVRCLRAKRLGRPGSYLDGRAGKVERPTMFDLAKRVKIIQKAPPSDER
jgi:hypothetical protein